MKLDNKDRIVLRKTIFQKRYRVMDPIRDFPGGTVYVGLNREDKSRVYLRVYHGCPIASEEDFQVVEEELERYKNNLVQGQQRVIELLKVSVKGIPHPIPVIVLERIKGVTARRLLRNSFDNQVPINDAAFILSEAALLYAKALENGFKISEIYLQDLMRTNEGSLLTMHLPLLPSIDESTFYQDSQQQFYAPPERWEDPSLEVNEKVVVYQLACLLFQMLEGDTPFLGPDQETKHKEEICLGLEGIPKKADKLLLKSLSKDPKKRPSLISFAAQLRAHTKHKSVQVIKRKGGLGKLLLLLSLMGSSYFAYDILFAKKKKKRKQPRIEQAVNLEPRKVVIEPEIEEIDDMYLFQNINFSMGNDECSDDCKNVHEVSLSDYYLDLYEVSNEKFLKYVEESQSSTPSLNSDSKYNLWIDGKPSERILGQPVINITWDQAQAYCEHYGKRLPTEAEWEFAARGKDGRDYPWGNDQPSSEIAQFSFEWRGEDTLYEVNYFKDGVSDDGIFNLFGGVKEWIADYYDSSYYSNSPSKDPKGPELGSKRVVRGGSWAEPADPVYRRDAMDPSTVSELTGFRCAKTLILGPAREVWLDADGNEVAAPKEFSESVTNSVTAESKSTGVVESTSNPELPSNLNKSKELEDEWGSDEDIWEE